MPRLCWRLQDGSPLPAGFQKRSGRFFNYVVEEDGSTTIEYSPPQPVEELVGSGLITSHDIVNIFAPLGGIALYQLAPPLPYLLSAATLIAMWGYAMMSPSLAADSAATRT